MANISIKGVEKLSEAVRQAYESGQEDYYLEPILLEDSEHKPIGRIQDGDSVVFCCRRGEREIQLTEAFTDHNFTRFPRPKLDDLFFAILTLYHEKFIDLKVAFAPVKIQSTLGEIVSKAKHSQLRVSESEKFAHVTFFFNGGNNQVYDGEIDVRIPSPKGIPFDQVPELCLDEVSREVMHGITQGFDLIVTNFANGDVIGHTDNNFAKVKCAEYIDKYLQLVVSYAREKGYLVMVTADHGNLEVMITEDGTPHVAHTTNLVPFLVLDPKIKITDGTLANIAPTILAALNVPVPEEMNEKNLFVQTESIGSRKILLVILDGWGSGKPDDSNPIYLASTPYWDHLLETYPHSQLKASGEFVGLKPGKAGNSEAGHMNIGAGRIIPQDDVRLDLAITDGSFYENPVILEAIQHAKSQKRPMHLIGLLTEKSSHGSIDYPLAILKIAKEHNIDSVYIHMILDGRSTEPGSAPALLNLFDEKIKHIGVGAIVTCIGRGYALDRDSNYHKTQKTFDAFVSGIGTRITI